jgi:hypothetical protein
VDPTPEDPAKDKPPVVILFRHLPDGTVIATCRGIAGVGKTEEEALTDLGQKLLRAEE